MKRTHSASKTTKKEALPPAPPLVIKKPEPAITIPDWINEHACGVSKANLEKVFRYMLKQGYTATRDIPDCTCMNADIEICCTDDMVEREPLCVNCAHTCDTCGEPQLQFFKSQKGQPVCYMCAGYHYGVEKVWWNDDEWATYDAKNREESSS